MVMKNSPAAPKDRPHKSSGNHWTGKIPVTWKMKRVKSLLKERNEREHRSEPLLAATQSQGVVLKEKYDNRTVLPSNEVDQFKLVRQGDFVISLRSFQGGIEYAYDQGIISPAYTIIGVNDPSNTQYLTKLFKSRPFIENLSTCVTGIRQGQNIDYERLQVQTIPIPPPEEQAAIVRFLDHADEQIQRYIAGKERLIALLEEERQALVQQAVTRGLDPNVRLKPSGIEWLGEVPEHWEVVPFKRRVGFQEGPGIMAADFRESGVPLLRISCLRGPVATLDGCNYLDPDVVHARWSHFAIKEGDYLLSASASTRRGLLGDFESGQLCPLHGYHSALVCLAKDSDAVCQVVPEFEIVFGSG